MKKPEIGSVYVAPEFRPDVAVQLVGRDKTVGDIARVCRIDGSGSDLCDRLVTLFVIGFPFSRAIRDRYLAYAGLCHVPNDIAATAFRSPNYKIGSGEIASWVILENGQQSIVRELSVEQCSYPFAVAVNVERLEELVELGWDGKDLRA